MMSRRTFLQSTSAAVVSAVAATVTGQPGVAKSHHISQIDLFPIHYPLTGYFKFFHGARGPGGRDAVLIKMTSDNGTVGWGQSVPIARWSYETLETAVITLRDYYAPVLIGRDPTDIEGALAALDSAIAPSFTTGHPITRAGLDIALHDLKGKLLNKPLHELLGRSAGGPVTLSWTVNVTSLDEIQKTVDEGRQRGYKNFNIKVGPDPSFDVQLAKKIRGLAPDGFLWADANGGYDPSTAIKAAPMLADAGVDILEAPVRPNRISTYQALKKQAALPILMDEGVVSPVELEEFIKLNMIDGMAMKPARCGGLLSNLRQIQLCEDNNLMWVGSGLTDPDISFAAALHLYSACGLKKPAALNGPQFLTAQVLATPIKIENAVAHIPQGPGLGIEVDEDKVKSLMKQTGGDKLLKMMS